MAIVVGLGGAYATTLKDLTLIAVRAGMVTVMCPRAKWVTATLILERIELVARIDSDSVRAANSGQYPRQPRWLVPDVATAETENDGQPDQADDERIERDGDSVETPHRNLWSRCFEDLRSQDVRY